MRFAPTEIEGVLVVQPQVFADDRGWFAETWRADVFAAHGVPAFVQDNHSRSRRGVLRGLHYQTPRAQGKLMRVVAGAVFDVVVDLRRSSPTFGRWFSAELSAANGAMLWAPPGLAHGFLTLSDSADFVYKCTDVYAGECEHTIAWNDPDLAIAWPLAEGPAPRLSTKDAAAGAFRDAVTFP